MIYLLFLVVFLWMIIVTVLLGVNRKHDKMARKKNDAEHRAIKNNMLTIAQVLRRLESCLQTSTQELKKTYNIVYTKIAPMMEKDALVNTLEKRLKAEEDRFNAERKLTGELASQLEAARKNSTERNTAKKKKKPDF